MILDRGKKFSGCPFTRTIRSSTYEFTLQLTVHVQSRHAFDLVITIVAMQQLNHVDVVILDE